MFHDQAQGFLDERILLSIISPPKKRGGLDLVEVYDRLGDRLSGQAIAKIVKRAVSRLRSREGSIIRGADPRRICRRCRRQLLRSGLGDNLVNGAGSAVSAACFPLFPP